MELGLSGKIAIITGGAGGFGSAIAEELAREGVNLIIADIAIDPAAKLAAEIAQTYGIGAEAVHADVTKRASARSKKSLGSSCCAARRSWIR